MSFFQLINELPRWLDEEIAKVNGLTEINNLNIINKLDHTSYNSYHIITANMGFMATASNTATTATSNSHQLWCYQASSGKSYAFGKYLEFKAASGKTLQFWIGLVIDKGRINLYLWFGTKPPDPVNNLLKIILHLEVEKREYWYKPVPMGKEPLSDILERECRCDNPRLDSKQLEQLEDDVKDCIRSLLDAIQQAGQTI